MAGHGVLSRQGRMQRVVQTAVYPAGRALIDHIAFCSPVSLFRRALLYSRHTALTLSSPQNSAGCAASRAPTL